MKRITYYILLVTTLGLTACVDMPTPAGKLLPEQVQEMESAQKGMLSGIVAFVNKYNVYNSSDQYYTLDWGYPCQMFYREVLGCDIPVSGGDYNYWVNVEKSLSSASSYTYYYYYSFINNCNNLIRLINPDEASGEARQYLGCALAFRALCYLDMARMFEFQPTGYAELDDKASTITLPKDIDPDQVPGIWGLTVPIVTDKTPAEMLNKNPRAPFTTMYRFILSDLNLAEKLLNGYARTAGNYPDQSVVYGLQARLWLEMATRFERSEDDLKAQLALEGTQDGYADLSVATVTQCYQRAADFARKAQSGYSVMTEEEWLNPVTGFNTAAKSWMLFSRVSTQEQEGNYYSSLLGTVCTEATWAMPQYGGGNYRCIGDGLYKNIPASDWRRNAWINPDDAKAAAKAAKQSKLSEARAKTFAALGKKYNYRVSDSLFATFPAYANMKFRARDVNDMVEGLKCDLPLMRMEEMLFIEAEATAHASGVAAGNALLEKFVNTRYTDGTYTCSATTMDAFNKQMMEQKRIEFWGEGICYFDYKRLRMAVRRTESTNYPEEMQKDSKEGFVCPFMNYYILEPERNYNPYVKENPDCAQWYKN